MKQSVKIFIAACVSITFFSCKKVINIDPISHVGVESFYRNFEETNVALTGCYNGLQAPLYNEWMFTELRSDNALQGVPNSSNTQNIELNELDMFTLNPAHDKVYDYWISTYNNIRAINYVLRSLGVTYENGQLGIGNGTAQMFVVQKNKLAGEALFLRAYHYFNLVRLYGGVFLLTEPVKPQVAKQINRSSVEEAYALILADLNKSIELLQPLPYGSIAAGDLGRATHWAAKSLLAKAYLTLNRKAEALPLLDDVITNSGHGLETSYQRVFSIDNEMNREIIFAVRYKGDGFGLGSPFANLFAPTGSGSAVVNNDGNGYDYPTTEARNMYKTPPTATGVDRRKDVTMAVFTNGRPYIKKFLSQVQVRYDAENDFPVIRFADVLLMKAEAQGYNGASGSSMNIINQIRERAGALTYEGDGDFPTVFYKYPSSGSFSVSNAEDFWKALMAERRIELAFENQRYFDMMRMGDAVQILKGHFANEWTSHYVNILSGPTLAQLQGFVTSQRLLLPIPQREIDTNDQIVISQNPGY